MVSDNIVMHAQYPNFLKLFSRLIPTLLINFVIVLGGGGGGGKLWDMV